MSKKTGLKLGMSALLVVVIACLLWFATPSSWTTSGADTGYGYGGGGGGGGGSDSGPAPTPGITDVREKLSAFGNFYVDTYAYSAETPPVVTLKVDASTRGLKSDGTPLTDLSILANPNVPPTPSGQALALAYNCLPDGATFSNPVTLTISYDPTKLASGIVESSLYIAWFDSSAGAWVSLPSTVDTVGKKVTARVSHFTIFGVLGALPAATSVPTTTSPVATTTAPVIKPASFLVSKLEVNPSEVRPGDTITVNVTTLNSGDVAGSYEITLALNGTPAATKTVNIAGHSSDTSTFQLTGAGPGSYTVSVENVRGNFTVAAAQPTVSPTTSAPQAVQTSAPPASETSPAATAQAKGGISALWIVLWACMFVIIVVVVAVVLVGRHSAD